MDVDWKLIMRLNPTGFIETTLPVFIPLKNSLPSSGSELKILLRDGDQLLAESHPCHKPNAPLLLLLHGLTGSSQSNYIQSVGGYLKHDMHIIALNFRNAGFGLGKAKRMYHSGLWQDLEDVLIYLKSQFTNRDIYCVGFSLGGNVLLKFLSNSSMAPFVKKAIAVSAPIDLYSTVIHMQKECVGVFEKYFMLELKKMHHLIEPYLGKKTNFKYFPKTMLEFDHEFTAKQWGYHSALDYYEKCSSLNELGRIKNDVVIIHAKNDPIVPFAPLEKLEQSHLQKILLPYGGHVGFHHPRTQKPMLPMIVKKQLGID
jgi:predicted alpha/beta-fold hydrolase